MNWLVNAFQFFNALSFVEILKYKTQYLDVVVYLMKWCNHFSQPGQLQEISTMLQNSVLKTQACNHPQLLLLDLKNLPANLCANVHLASIKTS